MKKSNFLIVSVLVGVTLLSIVSASLFDDSFIHMFGKNDLFDILAGATPGNSVSGILGNCAGSYDSAWGYAVCKCTCNTNDPNFQSCGGGFSNPMSEQDYRNLSSDWCTKHNSDACVCIKQKVVLP